MPDLIITWLLPLGWWLVVETDSFIFDNKNQIWKQGPTHPSLPFPFTSCGAQINTTHTIITGISETRSGVIFYNWKEETWQPGHSALKLETKCNFKSAKKHFLHQKKV